MEHNFLRPGEEDALASPACAAPPWCRLGSTFVFPGFKVGFEQDFPSQAQFCSLSCGGCAGRGQTGKPRPLLELLSSSGAPRRGGTVPPRGVLCVTESQVTRKTWIHECPVLNGVCLPIFLVQTQDRGISAVTDFLLLRLWLRRAGGGSAQWSHKPL